MVQGLLRYGQKTLCGTVCPRKRGGSSRGRPFPKSPPLSPPSKSSATLGTAFHDVLVTFVYAGGPDQARGPGPLFPNHFQWEAAL
eukprot:1149504-Pelagomonas_calceolata.AAC.2